MSAAELGIKDGNPMLVFAGEAVIEHELRLEIELGRVGTLAEFEPSAEVELPPDSKN